MVANYAVNMTFYFNGGWKQVDERLRCPVWGGDLLWMPGLLWQKRWEMRPFFIMWMNSSRWGDGEWKGDGDTCH